MEHAYGRTGSGTVGVEEELLLVDPNTRRLAPVAEEVLPRMEVPEGTAAHEAYAACLELRSPVCAGAGEAVGTLASGRRAAAAAGGTLLAAGVHPAAGFGEAPLVDAERYRRVQAEMRGVIGRTPECALHVHLGMPDPEAAMRACNGLRGWLPLLQGLTANSPWWFGRDSGLASARFSLVRSYPGRGIPPVFRDFNHYAETVADAATAGGVADYTFLWWDVRPHPRLGTVEVREMDVQTSLEDAAAVAALAHGLGLAAAADGPGEHAPSEAIGWSSFRAARDGVGAEILHGGSVRPLPEVARAAVELARPHLREAGGEAALDGVERILREGGGAACQRAAHAQGGMDGLLEWLVAETAGSA